MAKHGGNGRSVNRALTPSVRWRQSARRTRAMARRPGAPRGRRCAAAVVAVAAVLLIAAGRVDAIPELQSSNGANTFLNPYNASGMGPKIAADTWVDVACKVYAPQSKSANADGY